MSVLLKFSKGLARIGSFTGNKNKVTSVYCNRFLFYLTRVKCGDFRHDNLMFKNSATIKAMSYKSSKNRKKRVIKSDDEDSSDEEDSNFEGVNETDYELSSIDKGSDTKTYRTQTMRIDYLLKISLGLKRKTIDTFFYENKLRANGKMLKKKGTYAQVGDVIDMIKEVNLHNNNTAEVTRIEILKVEKDDEEEYLLVTIRKTKSLFIENY